MTVDHSPIPTPRTPEVSTRRRPAGRAARGSAVLAALALALSGCGGSSTGSSAAGTASGQSATSTPTMVTSASAPAVDRSTPIPRACWWTCGCRAWTPVWSR